MTFSRRDPRLNRGRIQLAGGGAAAVAPFFVAGVLYNVSGGSNLGLAIDDTNTISYAQTVATDPANALIVYVCWYRASDGQICVAKSTTGPTGTFTTTVGTATLIGVTDEHRTISAFVDSTGRLNVAYGMHGAPMNWWRATAAGDTLITDATKLAVPVVAGVDESFATYPQNNTYPDNTNAFIWRTGGSGNGNHIFYLVSGTTITGVNVPFLGNDGSVSFYPDTMVIEPTGSANASRTWLSFQIRETTDPLTAHDKYCVYSDDKGTTWKAFDGTALSAPMTVAGLTSALVVSIPQGTVNYYGFEGLCVGLDGIPTIVYYKGTNGSDLATWALRYQSGSGTGAWLHKQLYAPGVTVSCYSRPKCIWKDTRLVVLYSQDTSIAATAGKMSYITALGNSLTDIKQGEVFVRNGTNAMGISSVNWDNVHWRANQAIANVGPLCFFQNTRQDINPGSNGPSLIALTFSTTQPSNPDPNTIFSNPDYWLRADSLLTIPTATEVSAWGDKTTHGVSFAQVTSSKRPQYVASAVNGQPSVRADGVDDFMVATLSRVAPGTQPFFLWFVMRQNTWTVSEQWYNDGGCGLFTSTGSPSVRAFNGANGPLNAALTTSAGVGTWKLVMAQFQNSAADYLQIGSVIATGTNTLNAAGAGTVGLFATAAGASAGDFEIAEFGRYSGIASAAMKLDLQSYSGERYGFTLIS